jgi:hypothetical protein
MLSHVGKDEIRRNRRHLVQARLTEFAFHVVFRCKAKSAVELQARIGSFPRSLRRQEQRHVGFRAATLLRVEQCARLVAHQVGGLNFDKRLRDGELHALVLPDGASENDAFLRVSGHFVYEPVAVSNTFGSNKCAFGVESVENVFEPLTFFSKEAFRRKLQAVQKSSFVS